MSFKNKQLRIEELEIALQKYGNHKLGECDLLGETETCTCGLMEVING